MSQIDISSKLGKEKPTIKLAEGKIYTVDNSAETYLKMQDKIKDKDFGIETMYEMIRTLLGEQAETEIKEMSPSINDLQVIVTAISATVSEESYEEMEKRFQNLK